MATRNDIREMAREETITFDVESPEPTEPLDQRKIDCLAQMLDQSRSASAKLGRSPVVITESDHEVWAERLRALKIGALPFEIPQQLREELAAIEEEWASEAGLTVLRDRLNRFLAPLHQEDESLKLDEKDLELENERLLTLKMLADLLDELLKLQPEAPVKEVETKEEIIPSDQSENGGE